MTKREWRVPLVWCMYGTLNIEANTKEEAIALALGPDYPLPDNGIYLEDSLELDGEVEMTERTLMNQIEIYWDDLTPEKQAEILEIIGDNCNFDLLPICTIEVDPEDGK